MPTKSRHSMCKGLLQNRSYTHRRALIQGKYVAGRQTSHSRCFQLLFILIIFYHSYILYYTLYILNFPAGTLGTTQASSAQEVPLSLSHIVSLCLAQATHIIESFPLLPGHTRRRFTAITNSGDGRRTRWHSNACDTCDTCNTSLAIAHRQRSRPASPCDETLR